MSIKYKSNNELINKMDITDNTKKTYDIKFKFITDILKIDYKGNEDDIINRLKLVEPIQKINAMLSYTNIIFVLRRDSKITIDKIKKYREHLFNRNKDELSETNKQNNKDVLPTMEELIKYTNTLYNDDNYKEYIINYLIITCSCRNMDLDVFITDIKPNDKNRNYLYVKNDEVIFYRNNYKTVDKYGAKEHIIKTKTFIYACKKFIGKNLLKNTGKNSSKEIIEATYKQLGQGRYFKIKLLNSNTGELTALGKDRGTSPNVIVAHYDQTKGKELRKEYF